LDFAAAATPTAVPPYWLGGFQRAHAAEIFGLQIDQVRAAYHRSLNALQAAVDPAATLEEFNTLDANEAVGFLFAHREFIAGGRKPEAYSFWVSAGSWELVSRVLRRHADKLTGAGSPVAFPEGVHPAIIIARWLVAGVITPAEFADTLREIQALTRPGLSAQHREAIKQLEDERAKLREQRRSLRALADSVRDAVDRLLGEVQEIEAKLLAAEKPIAELAQALSGELNADELYQARLEYSRRAAEAKNAGRAIVSFEVFVANLRAQRARANLQAVGSFLGSARERFSAARARVPNFGPHRRKLEALAEVAGRATETFVATSRRSAADAGAAAEDTAAGLDFDAALAAPESQELGPEGDA